MTTFEFTTEKQEQFNSVKGMMSVADVFGRAPTAAEVLYGYGEALREFVGTDAISEATGKALTIRAAQISATVAKAEDKTQAEHEETLAPRAKAMDDEFTLGAKAEADLIVTYG